MVTVYVHSLVSTGTTAEEFLPPPVLVLVFVVAVLVAMVTGTRNRRRGNIKQSEKNKGSIVRQEFSFTAVWDYVFAKPPRLIHCHYLSIDI